MDLAAALEFAQREVTRRPKRVECEVVEPILDEPCALVGRFLVDSGVEAEQHLAIETHRDAGRFGGLCAGIGAYDEGCRQRQDERNGGESQPANRNGRIHGSVYTAGREPGIVEFGHASTLDHPGPKSYFMSRCGADRLSANAIREESPVMNGILYRPASRAVARLTTAVLVLSLLCYIPAISAAQRTTTSMEALVAPIALFPDPLLAQLLPAATYPDQVSAAAAFVATNGSTGIESHGWDATVEAVARYPEAIELLGNDPRWADELGIAFLDETGALMDAIQQMRARALASGALRDTPQQRVVIEDEMIRIVPAEAETLYVPEYDPAVVYSEEESGEWDDAYWDTVFAYSAGYAMGAWMDMDCDWWGHGIYFHGWHGWGGGGNYWQDRNYISHHQRAGGGNKVWNNPNRPGGSGNRNRPGTGGGNRVNSDRPRPATQPSTKLDDNISTKRESAKREMRGKMPEAGNGSGDRGAFDGYERGSDAKNSSDRGSKSRKESSMDRGGGRSGPSMSRPSMGGGGRRGGGRRR